MRRQGKGRYAVWVALDRVEKTRRSALSGKAEADYLRRMAALPRPAPLVCRRVEEIARQRRAQIRLAWSRPAPTFSLSL